MKRENLLLLAFGPVAVVLLVLVVRFGDGHWAPQGSGGTRWTQDGPPAAVRLKPETPEERALRSVYLRLYARRKFAPLLALLSDRLTPDQSQRLSALLADREVALAYATEEASRLAISVDAYFEQQTARLKDEIVAAVGRDAAAAVDHYLATLPQRLVVYNVDQVLIYTGHPLTIPQIEQLATVLHIHEVAPPGRAPSTAEWDVFVQRKAAAFELVTREAGGFLAPEQLDVLRLELDLQLAHLRSQRRATRGTVPLALLDEACGPRLSVKQPWNLGVL